MATRRESVLLELEDHFTSGIARAAVATKAFERSLNDLDGTSTKASKSTKTVGDETENLGRKSRTASKEIDQLSGRVRILRDVAVTLGPALIPIGAGGIPAVVGLGAAFGATAAGAGVLIAAVNGIGDAMKALDAYQLQPTQANLEKLQIEMDKLGPAGEQFVRFLDSLEPQLQGIQQIAREGLFPGVEDGISSLLRLLPEARRIVFDLATTMGDLARESGEALSGERFSAFFDYLSTDAAPTLRSTGESVGNLAEAFANLVVAFAPLTRDFTGGLESMTQALADWTAGLSDSEGFQGFLDYLRETGPQVLDLLGSLATTFASIVEAAAPLGKVVVPILTAVSNVLGTIASSDVGPALFTAIAGMVALQRATSTWDSITSSAFGNYVSKQKEAVKATETSRAAMARAGAQLAAFALIATGASDQFGLTNTVTLGLAGSFAGPWGVAIGAATGAMMDLDAASGNAKQTLGDFTQVINSQQTPALEQMLTRLQAYREVVARMGGDTADVDAKIGRLSDTIGVRNAAATTSAATASERYGAAVQLVGGRAELTESQIDGMSKAMEENRQQALAAFDAVTQYGQAVDDAAAAAAKGKRGIDANTSAGRENRDALSQLAAAWNNQSDAVRNNSARFDDARANFIRTALAMGATEDQARRLARQLLEIPESRLIQIRLLGDREANSAIGRIIANLAKIPKSIRTDYYVNQINAANVRGAGGRDGDPTTPYWSGGYTGPGGKYEPRGVVHAGEVVIPQELVRRDWSMLSTRYGHLPGFAAGGLVGATYSSTGDRALDRAVNMAIVMGKEFSKTSDVVRSERGERERAAKAESRVHELRIKQAEKELKASEDRLQAAKDEIQGLKDARAQFADAVKNAFTSDAFGFSIDKLALAQDANATNPAGAVQAVSQGAYDQFVGNLDASSEKLQKALDASYILQEQGILSKKLIRQLMESGNFDLLISLAVSSKQQQQIAQDSFLVNQSLTNQLGNQAGNFQYGGQIADARTEQRRAAKAAEESRDELREIKRAQHRANERLDRIEAAQKDTTAATKRVGPDVVAGINGAVSHGSRRG